MLSEQETLALAAEALDELELRHRLKVDGVGWPGAAGVLWVSFDDPEGGRLFTVYVAWELSDETVDGFKEKIKKKIIRLDDPPDDPFSVA
ncbi:MAG: hypothetical protein M3430_17655 [Acidobacteriota bacterium]|nr:hypothetical protein [Acidobacteriota bacterium]